MQDLALNVPTVIILLVIAALAVLAVRRMVRKGLCDCGGKDEDGSCDCCHGCSAANTMVESMNKISAANPSAQGETHHAQ
jgi:hypothetical protein